MAVRMDDEGEGGSAVEQGASVVSTTGSTGGPQSRNQSRTNGSVASTNSLGGGLPMLPGSTGLRALFSQHGGEPQKPSELVFTREKREATERFARSLLPVTSNVSASIEFVSVAPLPGPRVPSTPPRRHNGSSFPGRSPGFVSSPGHSATSTPNRTPLSPVSRTNSRPFTSPPSQGHKFRRFHRLVDSSGSGPEQLRMDVPTTRRMLRSKSDSDFVNSKKLSSLVQMDVKTPPKKPKNSLRESDQGRQTVVIEVWRMPGPPSQYTYGDKLPECGFTPQPSFLMGRGRGLGPSKYLQDLLSFEEKQQDILFEKTARSPRTPPRSRNSLRQLGPPGKENSTRRRPRSAPAIQFTSTKGSLPKYQKFADGLDVGQARRAGKLKRSQSCTSFVESDEFVEFVETDRHASPRATQSGSSTPRTRSPHSSPSHSSSNIESVGLGSESWQRSSDNRAVFYQYDQTYPVMPSCLVTRGPAEERMMSQLRENRCEVLFEEVPSNPHPRTEVRSTGNRSTPNVGSSRGDRRNSDPSVSSTTRSISEISGGPCSHQEPRFKCAKLVGRPYSAPAVLGCNQRRGVITSSLAELPEPAPSSFAQIAVQSFMHGSTACPVRDFLEDSTALPMPSFLV